MTADTTRRQLLAGGAALGWFCINGSWLQATPAQAQADGFAPQHLSVAQCSAMNVIADALVPGAHVAGIAAYIDSQLSAKNDSLLLVKYLGVPTTAQSGFYRPALDSCIRLLAADGMTPQLALTAMGEDAVSDWQGPPASFFSFVLRADALDVVYGTEQGFARLDIPYRAHITPKKPW